MEDKEFKMNKKNCCMCAHYCSLVNQGMWWCKKDHTDNMDPETCGDYDFVKLRERDVAVTSSSYETLKNKFESTETYKDIMGIPRPMSQDKVKKAKAKRKKQRGIKHGRRK